MVCVFVGRSDLDSAVRCRLFLENMADVVRTLEYRRVVIDVLYVHGHSSSTSQPRRPWRGRRENISIKAHRHIFSLYHFTCNCNYNIQYQSELVVRNSIKWRNGKYLHAILIIMIMIIIIIIITIIIIIIIVINIFNIPTSSSSSSSSISSTSPTSSS